MFKVALVAFLVFSASFSSSIVDNLLSDNSAKQSLTAAVRGFPTKIQFFQPNSKLIGNFVRTIFLKN